MKKIVAVLACLFVLKASEGQTASAQPGVLYGTIQKEDLVKDPYAGWFVTGYDNYQPIQRIMTDVKKHLKPSIRIQLFLGTWCGDSRREVPRVIKILDQLDFPLSRLQLVALGGSDSLFKQSPQHEEAGKGIFRVPTIIIYDGEKELNRINEYPCRSLEEDMLSILAHQPYLPNYKSFSVVQKWINDSSILTANVSARSLAAGLRGVTEGAHELNGLGYLLLNQNNAKQALKIFLINQQLYPESPRAFAGAGEAFAKNGDSTNSIAMLEKALELNKDPAMIKEIVALLYHLSDAKLSAAAR